MKAFILALVLISATFAQTYEEMNFLWSSWKLKHGKEYENLAVEVFRFEVFIKNYKLIKRWNSAGNTATLALNEFADLTAEEFGALHLGTIPLADDYKTVVEVDSFSSLIDSIPDSWDWRDQGAVTPVKNQGPCGSCWAFSTVASLESLYQITGHPLTELSVQQIVDCDTQNFGCNGGWPWKAINYVQKYGLETEADYPYIGTKTTCRYDAYLAIKNLTSGAAFVTPRSSDALKAAIYQQPVIVLVEADQSVFQFYASGVITSGCGSTLNHAITAVGYGQVSGQDAIAAKNSWGANWGAQGYVYISASTQYNSGLGACGILSQPQSPKRV